MAWTLDELVGRVAQALAGADVRAPNGRVTEVPDVRMIRWYITTGLVDRPLALRGRVGLYGPRHLLQLVAIKRRQSEGRSLAEIQLELAGATDAALSTAARVPLSALADAAGATDPAIVNTAGAADPAIVNAGRGAGSVVPVDPPRRDRFWTQRPALAPVSAEVTVPGSVGSPVPGRESESSALLHGVPLDGAVLLVAGRPDEADLAAIRAAAQPLLDLLAARGLLNPAVKGAQG